MLSNMVFSITVDNIKMLQGVNELMKCYWQNDFVPEKTCYYRVDKLLGLIFIRERTYKGLASNSEWICINFEADPDAIFKVITNYFNSSEYISLLASRPIPQYNDDSSYGCGLRIYHPNPYAEYGWNIYKYARELTLTNEYLPIGYNIHNSKSVHYDKTNTTIEILPFDENPLTIAKTFPGGFDECSLWDIDFIVEPYPAEYHK